VQLATLDKLNAERKGGKNGAKTEDSNMANAVARTEKIRDWVSQAHFRLSQLNDSFFV
jgi:hypothetical protein